MHIGQHVVCVDGFFDDETRKLYDHLPVEGDTYVIRELFTARNYDDGKPIECLCLLLVGVVNPPCSNRPNAKERGFNAIIDAIISFQHHRQPFGQAADRKIVMPRQVGQDDSAPC